MPTSGYISTGAVSYMVCFGPLQECEVNLDKDLVCVSTDQRQEVADLSNMTQHVVSNILGTSSLPGVAICSEIAV